MPDTIVSLSATAISAESATTFPSSAITPRSNTIASPKSTLGRRTIKRPLQPSPCPQSPRPKLCVDTDEFDSFLEDDE